MNIVGKGRSAHTVPGTGRLGGGRGGEQSPEQGCSVQGTYVDLPPWHWTAIVSPHRAPGVGSWMESTPSRTTHPATRPPGGARGPHSPSHGLTHLIVAGSVGDRAKLLGDGVAHRVGLAVFNVDGTNEQVVGDVVQVPTELEPGAGSRDVVSGTLSFDLGRGDREDWCMALGRWIRAEALWRQAAGPVTEKRCRMCGLQPWHGHQ